MHWLVLQGASLLITDEVSELNRQKVTWIACGVALTLVVSALFVSFGQAGVPHLQGNLVENKGPIVSGGTESESPNEQESLIHQLKKLVTQSISQVKNGGANVSLSTGRSATAVLFSYDPSKSVGRRAFSFDQQRVTAIPEAELPVSFGWFVSPEIDKFLAKEKFIITRNSEWVFSLQSKSGSSLTVAQTIDGKKIESVILKDNSSGMTIARGIYYTDPKSKKPDVQITTTVPHSPSKTPKAKHPKPPSVIYPEPHLPKSCPVTRSEDPTLWDECRAGYIRPDAQFVGVTSCKPNSTHSGYIVTFAYKLVGGHYAKADFNETAWTDYHMSVEDLKQPQPYTHAVPVAVYAMNGLEGAIDVFTAVWDDEVDFSKACLKD
jgi:hypothetical protein